MQKRRLSREQAFSIIFENIFNKESVESIIEMAENERNIKISDFAKKLSKYSIENAQQIDHLIKLHSQKWIVDRISKVALAILKMSIAEVLFMDDVPNSVSIDEALEISKTYLDKKETGFIHGVLGAIVDERKLSNEIK